MPGRNADEKVEIWGLVVAGVPGSSSVQGQRLAPMEQRERYNSTASVSRNTGAKHGRERGQGAGITFC